MSHKDVREASPFHVIYPPKCNGSCSWLPSLPFPHLATVSICQCKCDVDIPPFLLNHTTSDFIRQLFHRTLSSSIRLDYQPEELRSVTVSSLSALLMPRLQVCTTPPCPALSGCCGPKLRPSSLQGGLSSFQVVRKHSDKNQLKGEGVRFSSLF